MLLQRCQLYIVRTNMVCDICEWAVIAPDFR